MIDISKLNKVELKYILNKLVSLNSLKKYLWNRWIKEFNRINNWINFYKIEYYDFWSMSLSYIKEKSIESFKKLFWIDVKITEIQFVANQNLKWWFRIYFNDNIYDLSYKKFENQLKKDFIF